uniref:Uncharacterized protein n=1 Tax=uncultured bacterium BLR12 TaxID=506514 RepID=C0INH5_9BACT|nr:hypothetical protein AKSOIL_0246 [uncultured bacterium BLR12]
MTADLKEYEITTYRFKCYPIQIMNENRYHPLLFSISGAISFLRWLMVLIKAKTVLPLHPGNKLWRPRKGFLRVVPCQPNTIVHQSFLKSSI